MNKGVSDMAHGKILIADDEERIVSLVSDFLKAAGYETISASDGQTALTLLNTKKDIDLAILDIMMPQVDGWTVAKEIRKTSDMPIIFLSARSEEFDLLTGFESGADEYVTKPFSPAVLVKRVEALLRRANGTTVCGEPEQKGIFIDRKAYVAYLDGKELTLTLKEFELLAHLSDNAGRVLSRDQLLNAVWGYDYLGDTRTVDSHVARLRLKLGDFGSAHLKTVYGMGYKFEI